MKLNEQTDAQLIQLIRERIRFIRIKHPDLFGAIDHRNVAIEILKVTNADASEIGNSDRIRVGRDLFNESNPDWTKELDGVLAHEMRHVARQDYYKRVTHAFGTWGMRVFIIALGAIGIYLCNDIALTLIQKICFWTVCASLGILAGRLLYVHETYCDAKILSHSCEFEADRAAALVEPDGLINVLVRINNGLNPDKETDTHPSLRARLTNIEKHRR